MTGQSKDQSGNKEDRKTKTTKLSETRLVLEIDRWD